MTQMPAPGTVPQWTLADRLRKAREEAGLSQEQLEALSGVSRRTITNYEKGAKPKRSALIAWAVSTGVPLPWLLDGDEHGGPEGGGYPRPDSNRRPSDYEAATREGSAVSPLSERRRSVRSTRWLPGHRRAA